MIRNIIKIDEEKCNGCGACASACHEGAIEIKNGKAKLTREHYCDGLGDCLPACPVDAISFEEREAPAYDEAAVLAAKQEKEKQAFTGCPGTRLKMLKQEKTTVSQKSRFAQWPIQIKLLPVQAPFYEGADLLVAADCTAFSYENFHEVFGKGRVLLVGCPKLDAVDYFDKLSAILTNNQVRSVTVLRMNVPCCGGMENAVKRAIAVSGKFLPSQVIVISTEGEILTQQ